MYEHTHILNMTFVFFCRILPRKKSRFLVFLPLLCIAWKTWCLTWSTCSTGLTWKGESNTVSLFVTTGEVLHLSFRRASSYKNASKNLWGTVFWTNFNGVIVWINITPVLPFVSNVLFLFSKLAVSPWMRSVIMLLQGTGKTLTKMNTRKKILARWRTFATLIPQGKGATWHLG